MKKHIYFLTKNSVLYYSDLMKEKTKKLLGKKEVSAKERRDEINLIRGDKI